MRAPLQIENTITLYVLILPSCHVITGLTRSHGKQVCHHGAEPGGEAGLGNEAELELRQADDVVPLLPVPAGDVEQVGLVVVLHQLDDHPDVVAVVLDRDHPHDVGRVLRVRVLAVLVRQHQARVSLMYLLIPFDTFIMI